MKRVILLLSLFLVMSLVACGSGDEVEPTVADLVPVDESGPANETATDTPAPPPTEPPPGPSAVPATDTPAVEPTATEVKADPAGNLFASPEYGVQTFMWWRLDLAERDLALTQDLGFGWVKQSFAWRDIETIEKGKYDWYRSDVIVNLADEAGLKLLVRIDRQPFWSQEEDWPPLENAPPADLQDFADFCGALAERYAGRIAAYQVWNEPNLSREWGDELPDPAEYTELLRVCYEKIKAVDPEAIVVSAGLAPTGTGLPLAIPDDEFLQGMYDAGAADYFDALGLNAPGYKAPPETPPEEGESNPEYGGGRWFVFRHVEDMRQVMVDNGDADKQAVVLELGWTTDTVNPDYAWHAVTEAEQADYLVGAYQFAAENWQPWIGPMFTIYLADHAWTPEDNEQWWWSITLPDGTPRPAFHALREMDK
ncbi:MAG: hypothetical protein JSW55_03520 [Chloroflexota bacterium]|nr:MAG: hypothetical protein JSW55_03520 [Chloroflexota bacterium]